MAIPKPLDVSFHVERMCNGHVLGIRFARPKIVKFEPGENLCVLKDNRFPAALVKLEERILAPDKGPYSDWEGVEVEKLAYLMKKEGKGDLVEEARWLADILIPRIQIILRDGEERAEKIDIPDMRSHPDFQIYFNGIPDASRKSDDLMVPRAFLLQEKRNYNGVDYLPCFYTEELAVLATAAMRANGREAYMSQIVGPDPDGEEAVLFEGVAIFPDKNTLVHVPVDRTHPDVTGLNLQSDPAVLSILHLRQAANILKREFPSLVMNLEAGDLVDGKKIAEKLDPVYNIIEKAKEQMEENPEIPLLLNAINSRKEALFSRSREMLAVAYGEAVLKYMADLEHEIKLKKGIAKKRFGIFGYTEGVRPDEVERRVKFAIDAMVAGLRKYGPLEPLTDALALAVQSVEGLVHLGLSDKSLRNLRSYIAEKEEMFTEPWVPELDISEKDIPTHICAQGVISKLVSLHQDIEGKKGKVPAEEVKKRIENIIDHISEGFGQFGNDCKPIAEVRDFAEGFVKNVLPNYGYSKEFIDELVVYMEQKNNEVSK